MVREHLQWISCNIENTGFSSERLFRIRLKNGELIGTAHLDYLRREDKSRIAEGEPPGSESIKGLVACRIVKREGDNVLVEVPSTDVINVPEDSLSCV